MIHWKWEAVETTSIQVDDVVLVLGIDGNPSGELPGARYAVLRHRILAALKDQKEGRIRSAEWIEAEGARAVVLNVADKPGLDREDSLRCAAGEALGLVLQRTIQRACFLVDRISPERLPTVFEGVWRSGYRFEGYKSHPSPTLPEIVLCGRAEAALLTQSYLQASAVALQASDWVRDQVNEPGSVLHPEEFARRIEAAVKGTTIKFRQKTATQLEREGCQGILTVGKGSDHGPRMAILEYRPRRAAGDIHLALVGKGITFDTGGISLKPGDRMWEMKSDMAGAATAVGAILAIAGRELPINVTAILCLAENRPGNASVLPGDIFKARNGKTIMVDNTDAEGRLVLSDGLFEAGTAGATHIVDLATLTGAIVRALGPSIAGLFANDTSLSNLLVECGLRSGEKLWPMPLDAEYRERLKDPVADMRNIGGAEGGAITAALFLQEFVPEHAKWAHLDIAGTAFATKNWKYYGEGGTAFGLATLVELARRLSSQ